MSDLIKLRPYQYECIEAIESAWEDGMQRPAVVLSTGLGKGHPLGTEVPTPDGVRKWGDLRAGDFVFGSDGLPTEVTSVHDRGVLPAYRVTMADGSSVVVDGDHLWTVLDRRYRKSRTLSTAGLASEGLRHGRGIRFVVPMTAPVSRPKSDLPVDPYTLGSLIANGSLAHSGTSLSTPDPEVVERIRTHHTANLINDTTAGVCPRYSLPGMCRTLRDLGLNVLSASKRIPAAYLEAHVSDRIALLQGLMDGDGSSRPGGRRSVNYFTSSPGLADDMIELVSSLGGRASQSWYHRPGNAPEGVLSILLPDGIEPFPTSRRNRDEKPRRTFAPKRGIVSIDRVEDQEIRCITVAADDHLYLITRSHIVTHNTVIFSHLISRFVERTGQRAVVLVHREELADQAIAKLRGLAPGLSVGKVKASADEKSAQIVVASVQTLKNQRRMAAVQAEGTIGLVVADEVHHYASRTFQGVLKSLGCYGPEGPRMAGFTATLARGDGHGMGDVVQDVVYTRGVMFGISGGFLVQPEGRLIGSDTLNLGKVKSSAGDYQAGDLGEALESSGLLDAIPDVYAEHAKDRQGIVFVPTVANADHAARVLSAAGIPSAMVCGQTPTEERLRIYEEYRRGRIRVMTNAMVLTEGFDMPQASCAVIARPTKSEPLYTQMVGRVLRPYPGKTSALILDVVGASVDNKLRTLVDLEPGLFEDLVPCTVCMRIPCGCPCGVCERPKKDCVCPKEIHELKAARKSAGSVDLFAGSDHAWLSTHGGVLFLPAGDGEVFLWPSDQPGLMDVCYAPKSGKWQKIREGLPMGTASAWAETEAEERTPFNGKRKASWRSTRPSDAQFRFAGSLGLSLPPGAKKGDVGDAISVALASRKFDRFVR